MEVRNRATHSAHVAPGSLGIGKEGGRNPRKLPIVAFSTDRGKRRRSFGGGGFNMQLYLGCHVGGKLQKRWGEPAESKLWPLRKPA
jgi:hypothetical protein